VQDSQNLKIVEKLVNSEKISKMQKSPRISETVAEKF